VRLGFDQNGDEPSPWLVGEQPRLRFPDISLKGKKKRRGAPRKRESSFFNLE
jgi:hypothetical protein